MRRFTGDVTVATQEEADRFACFAKIDGSLTIADDPAALAIALPNLQAVTGDVTIVYSREATASFMPTVRTVSLPALARIGGDLSMVYPGGASDLIDLDVDAEQLVSLGGSLTLALTTFNASVHGLDSLAMIPGDLTITSSGSDLTLSGLLPVLTDVGGDVALRNGLTLLGALEALESMGGSLRIDDSFFNPGTSNFGNLVSVGGDLVLQFLSGLIAIEGLPHQLPSLALVSGELAVVDANGFSALLLGDPAGLAVGALRLSDNGSLVDLTAPQLSVAADGPITITDNAALCQTDAEAFVAAQAAEGWAGTATLTGNATCP